MEHGIQPVTKTGSPPSGNWLTLFVESGVALTATIISASCAGAACAILTIIVFLISFVLTNKCCNLFNLRQVTIGSFWYVSYLAMIVYPAFYVYASEDGPYRVTYLFGVESVLITVPLGWLLANRLFRFSKEGTADLFQLSFREPQI